MSLRFRDELASLMEELGVNNAELGRRLHKLRQQGTAESNRRQVVAWLSGEVSPREASAQLLATALQVPRSRLPKIETAAERIAALEQEILVVRRQLQSLDGAPRPKPRKRSKEVRRPAESDPD